MRLWNEYEGTTIAGDFPLEKLLSPEGRSAFFYTTNGSGTPAVIRLIEAHFDEEEILSRWQRVSDLEDPHLLRLKKFGRTELEGTPLVYAVMENSDADLAQVLSDRPLTQEETRQLASELVPSVQALHAAGLVHEHIRAANIYAIGETVKLRSDCVREAPEGAEGTALKARDVHDLAEVFLECLTQSRTLAGSGSPSLPSPFNQIIRNALSGAWGLQQISDALALPLVRKPLAKAAVAEVPGMEAKPDAGRDAAVKPEVAGESTAITEKAVSDKAALETSASERVLSERPASLPVATRAGGSGSRPVAADTPLSHRAERIHVPVEPERPSVARLVREKPVLIGVGLLVLLLAIFFGWHEVHKPAAQPALVIVDSAPQPTGALGTAAQGNGAQGSAGAAASTSVAPVGESDAATDMGAASTGAWHVIAFTYNRREQAQSKVDALAKQHAGLHPEVFTPSGRAPYLVALGGGMDKKQAEALRKRARSMGLPRDTFARNYNGRR